MIISRSELESVNLTEKCALDSSFWSVTSVNLLSFIDPLVFQQSFPLTKYNMFINLYLNGVIN